MADELNMDRLPISVIIALNARCKRNGLRAMFSGHMNLTQCVKAVAAMLAIEEESLTIGAADVIREDMQHNG